MSLKDRFESFVKTVRGFESVDELLHDVHLVGKQRADYFFWDRKIVMEQKVLIADHAHKSQKFIHQLMKDRRFVLFGQVSSRVIFDKMPDGEDLQRRMVRQLTKGMEDSVAYADRQTKDTREIFPTPDAVGIVMLLNESAQTLDFDLMRYGLQQVLEKRREDGSIRYPHNDGVILFSEAHAIVTPEGHSSPCFAAPTPNGKAREIVRAFAEELIQGWATFNQLPLVSMPQVPPRR